MAATTLAGIKASLLAFALLLVGRPTLPQTTYTFLTVIEQEARTATTAKVLFAPAFQGKTEVPLAPLASLSDIKNQATHRENVALLNQQLEAVTAAGWELVTVTGLSGTHEYVFRRRKPYSFDAYRPLMKTFHMP